MLTCVNKTRTFPCLCSQTCPQKPHPPSVLPNPGDLPVPTFRVTGTECVGHLARKRETSCELRKTVLSSPPKQHFLRCGAFRRSFKRCVFGRSGGFEAGAVRGWHCSLCSALRCGAVCPCLPSHTDRSRKWDEQSRHKQSAQVRTGWETRFSLLRLTLLLSLAGKEDSPTKRAVEEREVTISCGIQRTDGLKQNQLVW